MKGKCSICQEVVDETEVEFVDDAPVCIECLEGDYFKCTICEEWTPDAHKVDDDTDRYGGPICVDCQN